MPFDQLNLFNFLRISFQPCSFVYTNVHLHKTVVFYLIKIKANMRMNVNTGTSNTELKFAIETDHNLTKVTTTKAVILTRFNFY